MTLLLFIVALAGALAVGKVWGPDDAPGRALTERERRALSVAVGLGCGIPFVAQRLHVPLLILLGGVAAGMLSASVAGRRPFWHAYLTNLIAFGVWFVLRYHERSHVSEQLSRFPLNGMAALAFLCLVFALPAALLLPIWERQRKEVL